MITLLRLFALLIKQRTFFLPFALLIFMSFTFAGNSKAQVYYVTNDEAPTTPGNVDAIKRTNYNGTGNVTLAHSFTNSPSLLALDLPNNRAFISENYYLEDGSVPFNLSIKVINLSTNAVITTIPIPITARVGSIKYDPVNSYIYYVTQDIKNADAATATSNDALIRVKPDGTGSTIIASSISKNAAALALNIPAGEIYILQNVYADPRIITMSLSGTITRSVVLSTAAAPYVRVDMAYDEVGDYIYYLTSDNTGLTDAKDALRRVRPDGTGEVVIKNQLGSIIKSSLALDAGNNRAFFYDELSTQRGIYSINLTTGTTALFQSSTAIVTGIAVPSRPAVTSVSATAVSSNSATLGGDVTRSDISVTERGVVYSSSNTTPTIGANGVTKVANGTGTGTFSASITGLSSVTTYYVCSYATSDAGTSYGTVSSFSTLSNDNNLSGLSISAGTLSPSFSAGTTTYTASVTTGTSTITVTPTKNNANANIKVNGTTVASGAASGSISLGIGSNTITVLVTAQDNSTKTYTLTVTRDKTPQTITFNTIPTKTYGNADFSDATASSGLTLSYSSSNSAVATIVNNQIHIVGQGTSTITASQAGDATYLPAANVSQTLTVNPAAITVTAAAKTKVYGNNDPAFTYTITSGALVGSDTFTGNLSRDNAVGTAAQMTTIGTYPIKIGTLALSANYQLTFVSSDLTVTKRPLILAPIAATKVYGNAEPAGYPYNMNGTSYAPNDAMTGVFVRAAGENVGDYPLSIGNKRPVNLYNFQDMSANYDITFISSNVTITKRPLIFHPIPATKIYGNAEPNMPYMLDNGTSVAPGEGITGTFGRAAGEDIGTYALTLGSKRPVNGSTGVFTGDNYEISFVSENLTITPRALNIYAHAQSKDYGDSDPVLTTYIQGSLRDGDALTGSMVRAPGENVGTYAISQGTLALSSNYSYTFTGENLTINKKTINVTANAKSKTFGNADPALDFTADALPNGENFSGSLTRTAGEDFGSYAIGQGSLALSNNYTLNFTSADLTIGRKVINVIANIQSKTYGNADPTFTYSADALQNGDSFTGSLSRTAGENAGVYSIGLGTLELNNNYSINYTGANLSIGKGTLKYVANPTSRYFRINNPVFTGTVTGFANGETVETVTTGTLLFSSTATSASPMGIYEITGSGLNAVNYDFVQDAANSTALNVVASGDNTLSSLSASGGTLNPVFSPSVLNYGFGVANNVTSFDLSATINSDFATATLNGAPYVSGSTKTLPLIAGNNQFDIVVTAQDETTKTYRINIHRAYSTNNLLSSFVVNGVTFTPSFDPNVTTYHASVPNSVDNISMYGIAADSSAIVKGYDGTEATAANPFHYPVTVGEYAYNLIVTSQSGDNRFYTVMIDRAKSSDATLASFGNELVTLNSPIVNGTLNYTAMVAHSTYNVRFNPVTSSNRASITVLVNNQPVDSYGGYYMEFGFGTNTLTVVVTSEDGNNTKTYSLDITRTKSSNATLGTLSIPYLTSLNEPFDENIYAYTANLADSAITGLPVTAYSENEFATVKINGTVVPRFQNYQMVLRGGPNTFNIVVTSQDGTESKTYQLVLTRAGTPPPAQSPIARLASLTVSSGSSFSKNFNFSYEELTTVTAPNSVTSVRLFLNKEHPNSTITLNGAPYNAELNDGDLHPVSVGDNIFTVVVTAEDGVVTKTYELHVNRLPYVNVDLASLLINKGTLTPAFSAGTTTYNVSVPNNVETINVTPTAAVAGTTVQVNGTTISTASPTATVNLLTGPPTRIRTVVRAADGVTTKTYTINVTRLLSNDATLSSLGASSPVSPAFSAAVTNYTAAVGSAVTTYTIAPLVNHAGATVTVTVNGTPYNSEETPEIALEMGLTTIVTTVIAQDGVATKTYVLKVYRGSNDTLSKNADVTFTTSIKSILVKTTGPAQTNFVTSVDPNLTTIKVKPMSVDLNATVTVNGEIVQRGDSSLPINLPDGNTLVLISSTAQNGLITKTYSITIVKNGSNNANISLSLSSKSILVKSTGQAKFNYITSVNANLNKLTVKPVSVDLNATVTVNDIIVPRGSSSLPIYLTTDTTIIHLSSTAQNRVTTNTYSIAVVKQGSNNADISITLSPKSTLVETVKSATKINYITSVDSGLTTIKVKPVSVDANATVTVDGILVTRGSYSLPIDLTADTTVIAIRSTAQNGLTTKTYSIAIVKKGSNNANISLSLSSKSILTKSTGPAKFNYITSVDANLTRLTVKPTSIDVNATVTVNGITVPRGSSSLPVELTTDTTVIQIRSTAQDGLAINTYSITVIKKGSNNANISLSVSPKYTLVETETGQLRTNYTTSVGSTVKTIRVKPMSVVLSATVTVNGTVVPRGSLSSPINLTADTTIILVRSTAQNGITVNTYSISVIKVVSNHVNILDKVNEAASSKYISDKNSNDTDLKSNVLVHQGLSPNGDGINDNLAIDGLDQYTDNKISIINSKGMLVYDTKGYGLNGNVFDGHHNNGTMLIQGTYYYILEYKKDKTKNRKTGYIILKY